MSQGCSLASEWDHLNINSLRNKFGPINELLGENLVQYMAITETKLDNSFPDPQFAVPNFVMFRRDRDQNGGGLCTYIRSDVPNRRLSCIEPSDLEVIVNEVTLNNERWIVIAAYRPPCTDANLFLEKMQTVVDECLIRSSNIVITGDLNLNLLDIEADSSSGRKLQTFMDIFDCKNLVKEPTCFAGNIPTLIDVIITNCSKKFAKTITLSTGLSDHHNMVVGTLKRHAPSIQNREITYRSYKNLDADRLKHDIEQIPFSVCSVFDDIDDTYWAFNKLLGNVIDEHIPIKAKRVRKHEAPFVTREYRQMLRKKATYWHNYLSNKNNANWETYRSARNKCTSLKRKAIRGYFDERCQGGTNGREFWNTIRPFITNKGSRNQNTILLREQDEIITKTPQVCDIFNHHFANVAADIGPKQANIDYTNHPSLDAIRKNNKTPRNFNFRSVRPEEIAEKLKCLKANKATGCDQMPAKILKIISPSLATPLANLVNMSLSQSQFPQELKLADVSPIFKKKDNLDKANYRPVSILPSISKIFEGIMADQMTHHFETIFDNFLSAFRKTYGCQSLLLRIIEDWRHALDNKQIVGAVLTDLSKAFDCLPHTLLLEKLKAYGLSGNAKKLLESYLTRRKQRVKIGQVTSEWQEVLKGVPQGSILGPVLFNIFMNDLHYFINDCQLYGYADDNTLSKTANDVVSLSRALESDTATTLSWFENNHMCANPDKFQAIVLGMKNPELVSLKIGGSNIKPATNVTLLGMDLDNKLKFDSHIHDICRKAAKQINALKRLSKLLNLESRMAIFRSFIMSNFNYCCLVWHACGAKNTHKLEKLQERALRFVYLDTDSNYNELLDRADLATLHLGRMRTLATEVYKSIHKLNPPYIQDLYKPKITTHNLRAQNNLHIPRVNSTTYGLHSSSYLGAKIWNELPQNIKSAVNLSSFRKLVKTWSGENCRCAYCRI